MKARAFFSLGVGAAALLLGTAPVRAEVVTLSCTWLGGNGWMDMTVDVDLARSTIELVAPLRWNRAEPAQIDSRFITSGKIRIDRRTGMIEWGIAGDPPGKCKPAPPDILGK